MRILVSVTLAATFGVTLLAATTALTAAAGAEPSDEQRQCVASTGVSDPTRSRTRDSRW